jgi:hypothetical protein
VREHDAASRRRGTRRPTTKSGASGTSTSCSLRQQRSRIVALLHAHEDRVVARRERVGLPRWSAMMPPVLVRVARSRRRAFRCGRNRPTRSRSRAPAPAFIVVADAGMADVGARDANGLAQLHQPGRAGVVAWREQRRARSARSLRTEGPQRVSCDEGRATRRGCAGAYASIHAFPSRHRRRQPEHSPVQPPQQITGHWCSENEHRRCCYQSGGQSAWRRSVRPTVRPTARPAPRDTPRTRSPPRRIPRSSDWWTR